MNFKLAIAFIAASLAVVAAAPSKTLSFPFLLLDSFAKIEIAVANPEDTQEWNTECCMVASEG